MTTSAHPFPTGTAGLPEARPPEVVELGDGDDFDLRIGPVAKRLGHATVRLLAYNGSVPGPTLVVREGSQLLVNVVNDGDLETTVHWHGLRLDNRYDGTAATQRPLAVGGRFTYRLDFPDPGAYWYHPHIREDYAQELGQYGTIVVLPTDAAYWPPAHRELTITLDDILIEDGRVAPFDRFETNYSAMGRFGNVLLANGEPELSLQARRGEVVRLHLTNTANTRVFNVALPGARMKLVGGDSGHYERETFVEQVLIAPSERAVVDVLFEQPGTYGLEHRTPGRTYPLATIAVAGETAAPSLAELFAKLRHNADMAAERERMAPYLDADPDKTIALTVEMDPGEPSHDHGAHHHGHEHDHGPGGIEWEDGMVEVNRSTTAANTRWKIVDRATGAEGPAIDWRFRVGERVKIRVVNAMDSDHPMHHPFHIHGAGGFLILARDGMTEPNLVWKDTVLIPTGQTVDLLLEVTHPGEWMAHCHIAEHHESGMHFTFTVEP